ncbi:MAG: hypothetical protein KDA89_04255 [Planctomycetaceae bacterium]|nr:hypothetical protein [Planctomycetaceae bacterium]
MEARQRIALLVLICSVPACSVLSGCATLPYAFGVSDQYYTSPQLAAVTEQQVERGRPNVVLDTIGWVVGIPNKIVLFNRRIENHNISSGTEAAVCNYLAENDLSTVKVRINQYRPLDDWHRLRANKSVGAGWRYTLGTLSIVGETIIPGRVFGGDHFNPFSNTVHLYSDVPAIAVHEAAHAKDFAGRYRKGTYAAGYLLPGAPLYYEAKATNDALGYLRTRADYATQQEAYNVLYPAYGTYVGNAVSGFVPFGYFAGVIGGHIAGRWQSSQLDDDLKSEI